MALTTRDLDPIPLWQTPTKPEEDWVYMLLSQFASEKGSNLDIGLQTTTGSGADSSTIGTITLTGEPQLYTIFEYDVGGVVGDFSWRWVQGAYAGVFTFQAAATYAMAVDHTIDITNDYVDNGDGTWDLTMVTGSYPYFYLVLYG